MIKPTIHGLSNEQYHRGSPYNEYLSSSQLKWYSKSPRHAKFMFDNPTEEKSDALRFGSLFHDAMANLADRDGDWDGMRVWRSNLAVFEPPLNPKGQPFGKTTKTYVEACAEFEKASEGKTIVTEEEMNLVYDMVGSLLDNSGSTSEQVRKLLKWGKPEVSFFYETEDGIKLKVRPDLLTRKKIIDWKTTNSDDLSEEAINRTILKYGYHISASMYQWVIHEITGKWLDFYLVIVSKVAPHDAIMVDMANYGYRYLPDADIVIPGCGAMEFKRLLDLHIKCTKENRWAGAETNIPDNNGVRVLEITPPRYYERKFFEEI